MDVSLVKQELKLLSPSDPLFMWTVPPLSRCFKGGLYWRCDKIVDSHDEPILFFRPPLKTVGHHEKENVSMLTFASERKGVNECHPEMHSNSS